MKTSIISLALYPAEIQRLDELVEELKAESLYPKKVNRSTAFRELLNHYSATKERA